MNKTEIINHIIDLEGGYVNDPSDSGGETNFGITIDVARKFGYMGSMKDLSRNTAVVIYTEKYWESIKGHSLLILSEKVAEEAFDTSVNMGPSRAAKFLQRSLNALNASGRIHDLKVDGDIGYATTSRLKEYLDERGDDETLVKMLNCLQGAFYVELSERREKDKRFIYGWFKNRVN